MADSFCSFRVLSIQSHVVSGYVGNKCATFPLQLLGFEVDIINSVQLSNHTGYEHCPGQVLNASELENLVNGLRLNNIYCFSHLLTGYVGSASFLKKVVQVVRELKERSTDLLYACDPVLGDDGKMYVPQELLPIYRDELLPLADILTPNQTEAELLTGIKISTRKDVLDALDWLHDKGVTLAVITSAVLYDYSKPDQLMGFASRVTGDRGNVQKERLQFEIPKLSGHFTGTGDLFTALFMAWLAKTDGNLKLTCEKTSSTLYHVLHRTSVVSQRISSTGIPSPAKRELQLINSKDDIESPKNIASITELTDT